MKCIGPIYCDIYRDKKFCKDSSGKLSVNGICRCPHSAYRCEIGHCSFLYDITNVARGGGKPVYEKCEIAKELNLKIFKESD